MHRDEQAHGDDEPEERTSRTHACALRVTARGRMRDGTRVPAPRRRPPARLPGRGLRPPIVVASTDFNDRRNSRKFNRRSRNASTATSFAALSDAGCEPPARAAACARARQRNRSRSGAQNSSRAVPDQVEEFYTGGQRAPATPARGRWACACPGSRAAPAPSRRRTRPASARCSARCTTHLDLRGRQRRTAGRPR